AVLIFSGCTVIREPLNMDMPALYYQEGKCSKISSSWEYAKCASSQIEALKTDREILKTITEECVK
ncbi:MAG: hypothetical protein LBK92_03795, partial [Endomicrobium sp.]|nr:hypothetical protein [Endomicrobium sp.]